MTLTRLVEIKEENKIKHKNSIIESIKAQSKNIIGI